MKNICSGEKRGMLKFAIACAMMVSSVAFAASPGFAETIIEINNRFFEQSICRIWFR